MLEVQPRTLEEARELVRLLRSRLSIIELQFSLQRLYPLDVHARNLQPMKRRVQMTPCLMKIEARRRENRQERYFETQRLLTEALAARARLGALARQAEPR